MKLLFTATAAMIALAGCNQLGMGGGNNTTENVTANNTMATNETAPPADANATKPADAGGDAGNAAAPEADPAASGDKPAEGGDQPAPSDGDKPAE